MEGTRASRHDKRRCHKAGAPPTNSRRGRWTSHERHSCSYPRVFRVSLKIESNGAEYGNAPCSRRGAMATTHPPAPRGWMGQEIYGGALTRFPSLSDRQGPRGHRRHTKSRSPPTGALNWSLSHTPHAHHDCWFVS